MEPETDPRPSTADLSVDGQIFARSERSAEGGRFSWGALGLALTAGPAIGLMWAWLAEMSAAFVARSLLTAVLAGVFIGLTLVALARLTQAGHRPTILLAVVLAVAAAAVFPGVFAFVDWSAWPTWMVDGTAMLIAAIAAAAPALRVPYCNRCGSWYRTTRNGKIDVPTARRLAQICDIDEIGEFRSPRYRLSGCQGGCGPARCELSWSESNVGVYLARVWLDDRQHAEVEALLNGLAEDNKLENDE